MSQPVSQPPREIICRLLPEPSGKPILETGGFRRLESKEDGLSAVLDVHSASGASIHYVRISPEKALSGTVLETDIKVLEAFEQGALGLVARVETPAGEDYVWLPNSPRWVEFDQHGRIAASNEAVSAWSHDRGEHLRLRILEDGAHPCALVFPVVVFRNPERNLARELTLSDPVEIRRYRKSSWFLADGPQDFWRHFIAGSLYDTRTNGAPAKAFRCQQCAYAWWKYFGLLFQETRKPSWDLLQDLVAFSVLADMPDDGGWRHGYWSDSMETHSRFQLDGLLLLLSQHRKTSDPVWLDAAERGMEFVVEHLMETLDNGSLWFLHDTIEDTKPHHFRSRLFGKSEGNSLCINTHVQALTVLQRLREVSRQGTRYGDLCEKGLQALRRVVEHRPAGLLYGPLLRWIFRSIRDPSGRTRIGWVVRRVERKIQERIYWALRARYPRLRQPGGFTERDLTLNFCSDRYHVINVKDFLTLYAKDPRDWLRSCIVEGLEFTRKLIRRWGLEFAVERSPYYIEYVDILQLHEKLVGPLPTGEVDDTERMLIEGAGTRSLDYHTLGLQE